MNNFPIVEFESQPQAPSEDMVLAEVRECKRSRLQAGNQSKVDQAEQSMMSLINSKNNQIEHLQGLVVTLVGAQAVVSANNSAQKGKMSDEEKRLLGKTHVAALAKDLLARISENAKLTEANKRCHDDNDNLRSRIGILENEMAAKDELIEEQSKRIKMFQKAATGNVY